MKDFLTDEEMMELEATQSTSDPDIISDEDMAKLEAAYNEEHNVSKLESGARGLAQGASFGFADEIAGGLGALYDIATTDKELGDFSDVYTSNRDESRKNYDSAYKSNPNIYNASQVGGAIGTSFVPGLGGMGVAKLAAQGAAHGLGSSEADSLQGLALDTAIGGTVGAVAGGAGKLLSKGASSASRAGSELIEDLATAPITSGSRAVNGNMGNVAKTISNVGKVGDKFDDAFSSLTKNAMGTGNKMADKVVNQTLKKGSYFIPGVGKAVAAADSASMLPNIVQKGAMLTAEKLPQLLPKLGRYGKSLTAAAQRGGNSLGATHLVLMNTDPEYRLLMDANNNEE